MKLFSSLASFLLLMNHFSSPDLLRAHIKGIPPIKKRFLLGGNTTITKSLFENEAKVKLAELAIELGTRPCQCCLARVDTE